MGYDGEQQADRMRDPLDESQNLLHGALSDS
jgi:hypothetical protein